MQCPSCGALQEVGVEQCAVCDPWWNPKANETQAVDLIMAQSAAPTSDVSQDHPSTSKLIEFPGVSRSSLPQWRKELSERVREVHEKRAREAALEAAELGLRDNQDADHVAPLLELLPQAEVAPLNPIVTAALRRIERAHRIAAQGGGKRLVSTPGGAALAYATENSYQVEAAPEFEVSGVGGVGSAESQRFDDFPANEPEQFEKAHSLVVVPPQPAEDESQIPKPKPRRMIAENDPALNYLDSVPTSVRVDVVKYQHASALSRVLGAVIDLMVVALLCAPFAALVQLTHGNWKDLRVAATGAALFSVMSFLYFTISTALTGRTFGMRLFSLRIVDARTGLIPTGKQSAGRALVYLGTILTLGLATLYMLIDRDRQTAHDRLARTTVITV
ncbi:MAG: RDD family protein [Pyrinomonadaceae bacterium]|nr:RDD family protein [Pyrinomonadaceae bacterium]